MAGSSAFAGDRGRRRGDRHHPGTGSSPAAQVSVGGEVFVCSHHDAARDAEITGQCPGRGQQRPGRQATLLNGRPQLVFQLRGQAAAAGAVECHQKVRRKAGILSIGLLRYL